MGTTLEGSPMRSSSTLARVLTVVIAVLVTPIATGVLSAGGYPWLIEFSSYGVPGISRLILPALLQLLAIALLVGVVLTGLWSSAGLIAVGALSVVPLVYALFPALLLETYRLLARVLPREWIDGLSFGIPLAVFPVLGMMGVVLAIVRRRPESTGAGWSVAGLIGAPALLAVGAILLSWGIGRGQLIALQQFRFDFAPDAAAAVIGGLVFVLASIGATRWSSFALVLPALALLLVSLLFVVPATSHVLFSALPIEMSRAASTLLLIGAGTAVAFLYLAFTAVLLRVRAQSRRWSPATQPDASAAQPYPPAPHVTPYPPAAPPYPPAAPPAS